MPDFAQPYESFSCEVEAPRPKKIVFPETQCIVSFRKQIYSPLEYKLTGLHRYESSIRCGNEFIISLTFLSSSK